MTREEVLALPRTFEEAGIVLPAGSRGRISTCCPNCSSTRKKSKLRCLTVWVETGTWSCNHCEWHGRLFIGTDQTANDRRPVNLTERNQSKRKSPPPEEPPRSIPQEEVDSYHWSKLSALLIGLDCTAEEERAAIQEMEGMTRPQARCVAGLGIRRYIDNSTRPISHSRISCHSFCEWLVNKTRPTILDDWILSGQQDGSVLFFYVDINGQYRTAMRFFFDPNGHKSKSPFALYKVEDGFRPCLFGEHQLMPGFKAWNGMAYDRSTPVVLVESEKTVLLASHHQPQFIWLATSGVMGLTKSKASVLAGREVIIWFDRDRAGSDGAVKAAAVLQACNAARIRIVDPYDVWPDGADGYDIGDYISEHVEVIDD